MELYIPYDQKFHMSENLKHIIRNTIYRSGYRVSDMEGNTWSFTKGGSLRCLTCSIDIDDDNEEYYYSNSDYEKEFEVEVPFSGVSVGDDFIVDIRYGEEHKVVLSGEEVYIQDVVVENDGGLLKIGFDEERYRVKRKNRGVEVEIITPNLDEIRVTGESLSLIHI